MDSTPARSAPRPTQRQRRRGGRLRAWGGLGVAAVSLALAAGTLAPSGASIASPSAEDSTEVFTPQLALVDTPTREDKAALQELGLDLTEHAGRDYIEVVLHNPADVARLVENDFDYDVRIPDLIARDVQIARMNQAYSARVDRSPLPSGRTNYRELADYNAEMRALGRRFKHVKRFRLPHQSLDGRTVYGVEIGSDVRRKATGKPTFLLMGVHHAREWPSGELAMEFAVDLATKFGQNKRITGLLKKSRVIVVPVVNPDGFDLSRTDGEFVDLRDLNEFDPLGGTTSVLATPGRAYMRKNCRLVDGQDTPDGSCSAALASPGGFGVGVDLNRNYGGLWGGPGAAGGTPDARLDPTYRGAGPFSEPETQNVQRIVQSRQVTTLISNHTFSNLVLRPNGVAPTTIGSDGLPVGNAPDEAGLKKLGARMSAQNGYANIHGWELYDTTGTTEDWSYNATGGYAYTFEIGPDEFHPPFPEVVDEYRGAGKYAGKGNREAYLIALEHAIDRSASGTLRGRAPRGAILRLRKDFDSPTWESSFRDYVDTAIKVRGRATFGRRGRTSRYDWIVNPSTRPAVASRTFEQLADEPFVRTSEEAPAPAPTSSTDHEFVLEKDAGLLQVDLDWSTPDDLDLEVYRRVGDGLQQVATSGNAPGEKEQAQVVDAQRGTYVFRVINYASASPSYTVTGSGFDSVTKTTEGKRERYVLTCERPGGKVLQRRKIFIDRGQTKRPNFALCRKRF